MRNFFHPHYFDIVLNRLSIKWWSLINYLLCRYWHVKIGKKGKFRGRVFWNLMPDSSIIIGKGCLFNSSKSSNLIGVYSPCMISTIKRNALIEIGNNCGFSGTVIGCARSIKIGNNVRCGANTLITDTDWHWDDPRVGVDKPIVIKDNVWLGYGVKVLKGTLIGENSIIGACSVVTRDIPANVIAAGNPCVVIRKLK